MGRPTKLSDQKKDWFKRGTCRNSRVLGVRAERERFLIVCEGEKTEPNYFHAFAKTLPRHTVELKVHGEGMNTLGLVKKAKELREKAAQFDRPFDHTWVIFDMDSFPPCDFDNAITSAEANGIHCAWSNEAFELWYVLHFEYRSTPMARWEYEQKLTGLLGEQYKKNDPEMYQKTCDSIKQKQAIDRARRLYENAPHPRSKANPCTTVFKLVEELNRFKS